MTFSFCVILLLNKLVFYLSLMLVYFLKFSPWNEAPYVDAAEKTALGGLSLDGFLSLVTAVFTLSLLMSFILTSDSLVLNYIQTASRFSKHCSLFNLVVYCNMPCCPVFKSLHGLSCILFVYMNEYWRRIHPQ